MFHVKQCVAGRRELPSFCFSSLFYVLRWFLLLFCLSSFSTQFCYCFSTFFVALHRFSLVFVFWFPWRCFSSDKDGLSPFGTNLPVLFHVKHKKSCWQMSICWKLLPMCLNLLLILREYVENMLIICCICVDFESVFVRYAWLCSILVIIGRFAGVFCLFFDE